MRTRGMAQESPLLSDWGQGETPKQCRKARLERMSGVSKNRKNEVTIYFKDNKPVRVTGAKSAKEVTEAEAFARAFIAGLSPDREDEKKPEAGNEYNE
jgi:hypothetical protein